MFCNISWGIKVEIIQHGAKTQRSHNIIQCCDFMNVSNSSQTYVILIIKLYIYEAGEMVQDLRHLLCLNCPRIPTVPWSPPGLLPDHRFSKEHGWV